jgi:hypothetical protein
LDLPGTSKAIPNNLSLYRGSTGLEDMMFQFMMDLGQNGRHNQIPITQKSLLLLVKLTSSEKINSV